MPKMSRLNCRTLFCDWSPGAAIHRASMPEDALLEYIRVLREAITYVREDVEARTKGAG